MDFHSILEIRNNCIKHAQDLLKCSKLVVDSGSHNVAYHLAALTLEEIGKSVMVLIGNTPEVKNTDTILRQAAEDHSKKMFWALWGSPVETRIISKDDILSYLDLSKRIHSKRLDSLYVNPLDNTHNPSSAVTLDETKELIALVEARLNLEGAITISEPPQQIKDNLRWFSNAASDETKRPLIFGAKSISKLNEFNDHTKWISWLRLEFETADKAAQEVIQRELNKSGDKGSVKNKWQVKYKLLTSSHSISQKILNEWNSKIHPIQLNRGEQHKRFSELFITLTFPNDVALRALHHVAWAEARLFAISLSMAGRGYFWWYLPKDISRFYEKITDLENQMQVSSSMSPELHLEWGNQPLSRADLNNAIICLRFLPKNNVDFLNSYTKGISLFGKNDIHTRFEPEIFISFHEALEFAMKHFGEYTDGESLETAFQKFLAASYPAPLNTSEYFKLGEQYKQSYKFERPVTLRDCGTMKIIADLYILKKMQNLAQQEVKSN